MRTRFDERADRLSRFMRGVYARAAEDAAYPTVDALLFCGDMTDSGTEAQVADFWQVVQEELHPDTTVLCILAKNHDNWSEGKSSVKTGLVYYRSITGLPTSVCRIIGGCAFIGIDTNCIKDDAPEAEEAQFAWLTRQLENARDARFTFVFLHCPLVRESVDEPEDYFNFSKEQRHRYLDLFRKYGVDAVFAGHTHCNYTTEISGIRFYTANPTGNPLKHGTPGLNLIKVRPDSFEVKFFPMR